MSEQKQLMNQLTSISFAMDDTVLFLDTHPDCQEAMEHYRKLRKMRSEVLHTYETKFEPISKYDVHGSGCFQWLNSPWPWEGGNCPCGIMKNDCSTR